MSTEQKVEVDETIQECRFCKGTGKINCPVLLFPKICPHCIEEVNFLPKIVKKT